jgi:hypothetical protein
MNNIMNNNYNMILMNYNMNENNNIMNNSNNNQMYNINSERNNINKISLYNNMNNDYHKNKDICFMVNASNKDIKFNN